MDDKNREAPWRRAFSEMVGEDSQSMSPEEMMDKRRDKLRDGLRTTDVDRAVQLTKVAILDIIRARSSFNWSIFNAQPWRDALGEYLKVQEEESKLPFGTWNTEVDAQLRRRKRAIAELLHHASVDVVPRDHLQELLRPLIIVADERVTRFLVSEINAELPRPRILGFLPSHGVEHKPCYVALSDGFEFTPDFLTVCRIFDH